MRSLPVVLLGCLNLLAQDQPATVLEYAGKPLTPAVGCTLDDIVWAGLSCTEDDPCPMYLEVAAAASAGKNLFAAGNIHSANVTMYSVLLGSEDGHTWREVHPRIRGAALDRIQFADAETGWVIGEIVSPLPQDPFLLVTTDGGKTWRKKPIYDENRESRYGSIQQFFADRSGGELIIDRGQGSDGDRYERYESPDTGETWSIKETSTKPLRLKRTPAMATDLRVRTDNSSQSFRIERREGDRWTVVSAFAVRLGGCKPPASAEETPSPPAVTPPEPPRKKH